ncbi:MAG: hypothetical protein EYC67_17815 [Betaproteobacteria bacterium]|nr:MAG: hypothetical protein EYC67_17815 [Betaproteobacteria bacterium]
MSDTRNIGLAGLACMAMVMAGCSAFAPYRLNLAAECTLSAAAPSQASEACRNAPLEKVLPTGDAPGFEVAYVEFTDQGWLHKRKQMDGALAQALPRAGDPRPVQLVVFVHGWKHNAGFDDDNVRKFRSVILPAFAKRVGPGVRTLGLYMGWRGNSIGVTGLDNITFYDRKATAEHVARGSIRELFSRIRVLNEKGRADGSVRVVLIGHSFGGLIVFNAIAESLLDELVRAQARREPPRPLLDLALVLNPAFEASRFEPLFQVAKSAPRVGPGRPLFVSITATNDSATGMAFPAGRVVNSLFDHEGWTDEDRCTSGFTVDRECPDFERSLRLEKQANTHTMGHMPRYATHDLSRSGDGPVECLTVPDTPVAAGAAPALSPQAPEPRNDFPLWTMRASPQVVDNHSGIYDRALWDFVTQLAGDGVDVDALCTASAGR